MSGRQVQNEPFIIHFILKPNTQTDLILKLVQAYSIQLEHQHPEYAFQFKQKEEKILRHKQKLRQINQMSEDQKLRDKILQEIQIKDYQKQYEKALANKNGFYIEKSKDKTKQNKSLHFTNRNFRNRKSQQNLASLTKNTQRQKSMVLRQQPDKKFRSSIIKKGSFTTVKKSQNQQFNHSNFDENMRKSEESHYLNQVNKQFLPSSFMTKHKNDGLVKRKMINDLQKNYNQSKMTIKDQKMKLKRGIIKNNIQQIKKQQLIPLKQQQQDSAKYINSKTKRSNISNNQHNQHIKQGQQKQNIVSTFDRTKPFVISAQSNDNPYHINHFIKQMNSYHYTSNYDNKFNITKKKQNNLIPVDKSYENY